MLLYWQREQKTQIWNLILKSWSQANIYNKWLINRLIKNIWMGVREFDDIVFIFDSDTSALLRTRNPLLWQEKINGWTHELSMLTADATNEICSMSRIPLFGW